MFKNPLRTSALLAIFAGSAILSSSASAQITDAAVAPAPVVVSTPVADAAVTPASGARIAPSGVTSKLQMSPVTLSSQARDPGENVGRDRAMMGAGLAAVVIGLLVGSDIGMIFVIGGALIGLVGLFHYMQ